MSLDEFAMLASCSHAECCSTFEGKHNMFKVDSSSVVELDVADCLRMRRPLSVPSSSLPSSPSSSSRGFFGSVLSKLAAALLVDKESDAGPSAKLLQLPTAQRIVIKGLTAFTDETHAAVRNGLASTKSLQLAGSSLAPLESDATLLLLADLLSSINVGLVELKIDAGLLLDARLSAAVCDWLCRATSLQRLTIDGSDVSIGVLPTKVWAEVLPAAARLSTLRSLTISRVECPASSVGSALAPLLQSHSLQSLELHSCFRQSGAWGALDASQLSAAWPELESLCFSSNHLDANDVAAITKICATAVTLTSLSLARSIEQVDHSALLVQASAAATNLRTLNLAFRSLHHGFMRRRTDACFCGDFEAFDALFDNCTSLHTLCMDDTPFLHTTAEQLVELLERPMRLTCLSQLGVSTLLLGSDGLRAGRRVKVMQHLERNRALQWPRVRHRLVPILAALSELDLPAYVTLEIMQRHDTFLLASPYCQLIQCIIKVKDAHRRKQLALQDQA
jgi:hypothetical protein